jgi:hypothetical protein
MTQPFDPSIDPRVAEHQNLGGGVAAAATGLAAGLVFGPAAGIGFGLLQGVLNRREEKSILDMIYAEQAATANLQGIAQDSIEQAARFAMTETDAAQLANWERQRQGLIELANSPDPRQRQAAQQGLLEINAGVSGLLSDIESRDLTEQRSLVRELAIDLRGQFTTALQDRERITTAADEMLTLLNDPDFDPNSALSRGRLAGLLETSTRNLLTDPTDFMESMQRMGGGGLLSEVIRFAGGYMKGEEFKFSRDDWRRVAMGMRDSAVATSERQFESIGAAAQQLNPAAEKLAMVPQGFRMEQFIITQDREFPDAPDPRSIEAPGGLSDSIRERTQGVIDSIKPSTLLQNRRTQEASTAISGGLGDVQAAQRRSEMFAEKLSRLPAGSSLSTDPNTGELLATLPNGERRVVPTSEAERRDLMEDIRRQRERRGKRVNTR